MEVFVAKQPIFNEKEEVTAYELLYRNSKANGYSHTDGDKATSEVIVNSFLNIGLGELSKGKPCFINFTENLLKLKLPTYFTPLSIVVEILENVKATPEVIELCKELKAYGYTIALDDFFLLHGDEHVLALLEFVDIIKIDFRSTTREARNQLMDYLKPFNLKFLAEKVETREEYEQATVDGYSYFQGYFFSKPVILQSHDIPSYYFSYLLVLEELDMPVPDIDHITQVIEKDLSISYKLLKLINSPTIRPKYEVSSIKQAVVLLGLIEIKKWIYVLSIKGVGDSDESSKEIIHLSLTRAKIGELLGTYMGIKPMESSKYFLLGMFSLIDTILRVPMDKVLAELPLSFDIKNALKGEEEDLGYVLELIKALERMQLSNKLFKTLTPNLSESDLFEVYSKANLWADQLMREVDTIVT
ncbi:EAL and HDOD domain-containing protein [Bacillus suaedaesalsae]|uniref:EAL domain-containing protein n=1 Tax=Bacillus suaedaesalsae TaxID=2810349 RepID=A0ABS2DJR5_9BACI|nr:EAL domain-containing protein [Bacillus suaedaesalsae]MBM6618740.1 EAL domain-containing protein [Bacillus suaedaesalsae]